MPRPAASAVLALVLIAPAALAQDRTIIETQVSYDNINWFDHAELTGLGSTIYARVIVRFEGQTPVLGLGGLTFQPTISPVGFSDSVVAFTDVSSGVSLNTGLPAHLGRINPFAFVGMGPASSSGPLTVFHEPSLLRIAAARYNSTTAPSQGVPTLQLPPVMAGTNFNTSQSPVVFTYAVTINEIPTSGFITLTTPLLGINNQRVGWSTSQTGTNSLNITLTDADIHSAQIYIGGNPCLTPFASVSPNALHLHPSYLYHSSETQSHYSLALNAFSSNASPICGPIWTWRHDGVLLTPTSGFSGVYTPFLSKQNLTWPDRGSYQVSINTAAGTGTATATIATDTCITDFDDGSYTGAPDGGVTLDDLLYYLLLYAAGDIFADIDDGSGTGTFDNGVTIDDLIYYLARYELGC